MQIFGFRITRASEKETEDLALGMFHTDGTVNFHGVAMGVVNLRHRLGKIDGKLMVITALLILDMTAQFPWVKAILAPAAALAYSTIVYVTTGMLSEADALAGELK